MPAPAELGTLDRPRSSYDIVLIPMDGIPPAFLNDLQETLEEQHKFNILVTTHMGKNDEMRIEETKQYDATKVVNAAAAVARRLGRLGDKVFYIALTNEDINTTPITLRFNFSVNYDGISVVSLARMNPATYDGESIFTMLDQRKVLMTRLVKMINKSIGREYYGYDVSSDINSVMYGPIMGLSDLDEMGSWY